MVLNLKLLVELAEAVLEEDILADKLEQPTLEAVEAAQVKMLLAVQEDQALLLFED
jgi:hypothetical protein